MQALVLIEELGSIRAAAQAMNLTQPALTAAIGRSPDPPVRRDAHSIGHHVVTAAARRPPRRANNP